MAKNILSAVKNQLKGNQPVKYWRGNDGIVSVKTTERVPKEEYNRRVQEIIKCKNDILYFAENYFHIITLDTGKTVIKPFQKQRSVLLQMQQFNRLVLLASRQTFKTTTYCIFCLWYLMFHADKKVLIVANKKSTSLEILARVRFAYELLPNWLKPAVVTYNKSNVEWSNNSSIEGEATSSEAARSKSANVLIVDEAARIRKNVLDVFWTSVYPIISSGKSSKVMLVSTPNGIGNLFHETYSIAKEATDPTLTDIDWVKIRVDWWDRPERDEKWKQQQLKAMSQDEFDQEFGNSFLSSSDKTLVKMARIERFLRFFNSAKFFYPKQINYKCISGKTHTAYQWFTGYRDRTYVMGVDTSEGIGENLSTIIVLDVTDVTNVFQTFSFSSATISYQDFSYMIHLVSNEYNIPPIAGENNGVSSNVFTILSAPPYENENFVNISSKKSDIGKLGIWSSSKTKLDMCLFFRDFIESEERNTLTLFDKDLVDEMLFFGKVKNSFRSVTNKKTDDRIMALILAIYTLKTTYCYDIYNVIEEETLENGNTVPKYLRQAGYDGDLDTENPIIDREDSPNYGIADEYTDTKTVEVTDVTKPTTIDNKRSKKKNKEIWYHTAPDGTLVPDMLDITEDEDTNISLGNFDFVTTQDIYYGHF